MKEKIARFIFQLGIVLMVLDLVAVGICFILAFALMKEELFLVMLLIAALEIPISLMVIVADRIEVRESCSEEFKAYRRSYKKLSSSQFEKISIRGRVAYAICCLENAMETYGVQGESWNLLLKNLWSFTTLPSETAPLEGGGVELILERWVYINDRFLPSSVIETDYSLVQAYNMRDGFPNMLPDEETYNRARYEFIAQSNDVINEICRKIYNIGSCEIWGGLDKRSLSTLHGLQKLIDYMKANDIPLPDVEPFKQYEYAPKDVNGDYYGWGYTFDGRIHSKYLKKRAKQEEN